MYSLVRHIWSMFTRRCQAAALTPDRGRDGSSAPPCRPSCGERRTTACWCLKKNRAWRKKSRNRKRQQNREENNPPRFRVTMFLLGAKWDKFDYFTTAPTKYGAAVLLTAPRARISRLPLYPSEVCYDKDSTAPLGENKKNNHEFWHSLTPLYLQNSRAFHGSRPDLRVGAGNFRIFAGRVRSAQEALLLNITGRVRNFQISRVGLGLALTQPDPREQTRPVNNSSAKYIEY